MKIQSTKHNYEILNDLVKKELPEVLLSNKLKESFDDDVYDSTAESIIESEVKIEHFEVEQDFSLCDISTEYFCILCEKYFETQDDLDLHKRVCFSKGKCIIFVVYFAEHFLFSISITLKAILKDVFYFKNQINVMSAKRIFAHQKF